MGAKQMGLGCAAVLLAAVSGCLERTERIQVKSDGSVELDVRVRGEPSDVHNGDAMPSREGGWQVKEEVETDDADNQKVVLTAQLSVPRGRPLPGTYAAEGDPREATALRFPTEVTIERRPDGTYYHFRRVYEARQLAEFDLYQKRFEKYIESLHLNAENPIESLSFEDRRNTIGAMVHSIAMQQASLVMAAAQESNPEWPQDYALRLRERVEKHFQTVDVENVAELLGQGPSDERDAAVSELADGMVASTRDELYDELGKLRVSRRELDGFFAAYEEEELRREITKDVRDETWEVRLRMPGDVVAHNGDSADEGEIVWQFEAEALLDRDQVLMATTRVRGHRGAPPRGE